MKPKTLTQQIDAWATDHQAALATLTTAEQDHLHAAYALSEARARAEQRVRSEATAKLTEGAVLMAVALDQDVAACAFDALDAESTLIAAKNGVEASRTTKASLAWLVALVTTPREALVA